MTQISNQFEMEGMVRWARYRDAVHIGEIHAKALVAVDKLESQPVSKSVTPRETAKIGKEENKKIEDQQKEKRYKAIREVEAIITKRK